MNKQTTNKQIKKKDKKAKKKVNSSMPMRISDVEI